MAERSFAREVQDLKLGDGEEFRGEGILAITKALLQSGVAYVGGYQGAPISHLMDVLNDAKDVLDELGVHFENSASEAAAAATLAASVHYPIRGAVTFKVPGRHQCRLRCDRQSRLQRRHRRSADHHRRGLRRRLLDHAGAVASVRHEVASLAARSASEPAVDRQGRGRRLRAFRSLAHAGDAGSPHPRLPRAWPLRRQGQQAAGFLVARGAGEPAARHRTRGAAARLLSPRAGKDRAALAGRRQVRQGAQAQRIFRTGDAPMSASSCRAASTIR